MGKTWSEPKILVSANPGEFYDEVITAEGIRVYKDRLIAYFGVYEYAEYAAERFLVGNPPRHAELHRGKASVPTDQQLHQRTRTEIRISEK